jgi:hypothetical protein
MKRPSFQFYPSDWLTSPEIRICSIGARGLWIDMICWMHQGAPYGHLKVGGKVILPPTLAQLEGYPLSEVEGWLKELEEVGVFSKTDEGCIYSRRMVRDEELRRVRAAGGLKGGNPDLLKRSRLSSKVNLSANLSANLPPEDEDEDEDEGVNGIEKVLKPRKAFVKPTQGEVKEYCRSLGLTDNDAVAFWEGKEANGWRNGSTKIKDWQATIRSWKANGYHPSQKQGASTKATFVDRNAGTLNAKVTGYEGL